MPVYLNGDYKMLKQIIITGFGGQGIVMAGRIVGKAAAIGDKHESTFVQSYGPESRGGASNVQVTISDTQIYYPYIQQADILVGMSQPGYEKYRDQLKEDGILIVDQDLVTPEGITDYFAIPCMRFAEEMGLTLMANIIIIGFFTAVTGVISLSAARNTVAESVPKKTIEINLKAFERGWEFAQVTLKAREKKASGHIGVVA